MIPLSGCSSAVVFPSTSLGSKRFLNFSTESFVFIFFLPTGQRLVVPLYLGIGGQVEYYDYPLLRLSF
jgi:hypothetical protein